MIFSSWKKKITNPNDNKNNSQLLAKEQINLKNDGNKTSDKNSSPSLIGKEIKIVGKVSSTGELQLDGVLEGEIMASKLVIETSAKVIGSVSSEDLVIKGRIIGPVFGKKVRFGSSARVEGDTFHETIAIEDGAYYEGSIKRHTKSFSANNKVKD